MSDGQGSRAHDCYLLLGARRRRRGQRLLQGRRRQGLQRGLARQVIFAAAATATATAVAIPSLLHHRPHPHVPHCRQARLP